MENDLPIHNFAGSGNHLHNRFGGDRFTAATFANNAQGLAALDLKGGSINRLDDAITDLKLNPQTLHFDKQIVVLIHYIILLPRTTYYILCCILRSA